MIVDDNALYGDELLVSVFSRFGKGHRNFRIINETDIVTAFYKARETGDFEGLFTNYGFSFDGLEPHSKQLQEGIDTMQQAGLLSRKNPYLVDYSVSDAVDSRYKRFIQKKIDRNPEWGTQLTKLANFVAKELSNEQQRQA